MDLKIENPEKILVLRTDNLGDALLTIPLLYSVKKAFPDSELHFLSSEVSAPLISNFKFIDFVHIKNEVSDAKKVFSSFDFDMTIHARPLRDEVFAAYLSGVRIRIGTAYRWYSFLLNHKVREHRKDCLLHESVYNFNLFKSVFPEAEYVKSIEPDIPDSYNYSLTEKLASANLSSSAKFVIIHPGSRGSAKDLPIKTLNEYVDFFLNEFENYVVILTGTENERHVTDEIINTADSLLKTRIKDLTGVLDVNELALLIKKCEMFVSNSTGPIHIAGLLNKKIIGFYPDVIPLKPSRWKPLSDNAVIITPGDNSDDMKKISVDEIMRSTELLLNS